MPDDRLTLKQAAALVGHNPASLRQAVLRGKLTATQEQTPRGPVWYTTRADLDRYLDQRPAWFKGQRPA
jgi:hypothetical protein